MITLTPDWCHCPNRRSEDVIYFPDQCCPCGIEKHHYHCTECGAIVQVG